MIISEVRDLKHIEGIEVIDDIVDKLELEKELNKFDLVLRYSHTKKKHYIYSKGDISEKLYKDIEFFTPYEIITEFFKMKKYFKEQEQIIFEDVADMSLSDFIKADKQGHKKVTEIMNKYFINLELKEKRRIRNEYDDVREYVYYKYLSTI